MEKKSKNKTQVLAYSRRQKENDTFSDIADALPIQENAKDLDKASILRLAINYLKLRDLIQDGREEVVEEEIEGVKTEDKVETESEELSPDSQANHLSHHEPSISDFLPNFSKDAIQALDGFLMVMSRDGRILFSSDSISSYLGLRQVDVIGQKVQDIIHPQDCTEVIRIFQSQGNDSEQVFDKKDPLRRKFVVRMRCAFTPSVRSISRCSNFKPIFCSCYLKFGRSGPGRGQFLGLVVFCKLATVSRIKEMVVGTFFKTKHSLDLSYTSVDTRIRWILGYDPMEMTGLKAYQYFHPQDLGVTSSCHMNLLSRGMSHSPCYRFMTRWGDWVWCRSKSEMVFNKKSLLPEGITIYTWIVRVEEEDDRMLAIQNGGDGEEQRKKYDQGFSSSISSDNGSLDVASLADPGVPNIPAKEDAIPLTLAEKPSANLSPIASDAKINDSTILSPPASAESSPYQLQQSPTHQVQQSPTHQVQQSTPYQHQYSPPYPSQQSPPYQFQQSPTHKVRRQSPPYQPQHSPPYQPQQSPNSYGSIDHTQQSLSMMSSPPHSSKAAMMGGVYSPPGSVFSHSPHSVAESAGSPQSNLTDFTPNLGVVMDQCHAPSNTSPKMSDSASYYQNQQSFALSPPYTPFSQNTTPFTQEDDALLSSAGQLSEKDLIGSDILGMPSGCIQGSVVGDLSLSVIDQIPSITPTPVMPVSDVSERPLALPLQTDNLFTTPPVNMGRVDQPMPPPTNQILSMSGHVTHYCSQSSTPSPPMESQFVSFPPNGIMSEINFTVTSDQGTLYNNPSSSSHRIQQGVVSETRARYGGISPAHVPSAVNHREVGPIRGHASSRPTVMGQSSDMGSRNVSQWSQWLKNGTPESVC